MYAASAPFPVYDNEEWWKDSWSALDFGREYNPSQTFTEQFKELMNVVPKMARVQQGENINSQYTNCASNNKNCYLIFSSNRDEDCLYGTFVNESKNCLDCSYTVRSELSYECIHCDGAYRCRSCRDCISCSDSLYLIDCVGCRNCFGCVGLRNKEFSIFNEQFTKEEYEKKLSEMSLGSHSLLQTAAKVVQEFILRYPRKYYIGTQNESVSGDHILHCKNTHESFDVEYMEDCKWCVSGQYMKDAYDISHYGASGSNELLYECEGVGHTVMQVLFSKLCWGGSSDLLYCYECFASKNCFGCIGLRHAEYCILNKQYSKPEYEKLVPLIIEKMRGSKDWGEFFSPSISPFGYNETVANEYFPMIPSDVRKYGWNWSNESEKEEQYLGPVHDIPDDISNVSDEILRAILLCEVTKQPYKIIPQELKFYREMNVPISRKCPSQRHKERMALRNPRKLWNRECAKCQKPIATSYSPDRPEIVYCESCYLETVY